MTLKDARILFINQQKLIIFRNGNPLLANVSGSSQSMIIGDADYAILECIAMLESGEDLLDKIANHSVIINGYSHLSRQQYESRIQQYKDVHALIDSPTVNPPEIQSQAFPSVQVTDSLSSLPAQLRVSTHLAIAITDNGFSVWSSKHNCFIQLTALDAITILSFGDGARVSDIINAKQPLAGKGFSIEDRISCYFNAGLLAKAKDNNKELSVELKPFDTTTKSSIGFEKHWQEIDVSKDKIPVYFVPHMENHFPLALGVLFSALVSHQQGSLLQHFQFIPLNFLTPDQILQGPYRKFGPGVWLFSNYMWSIDLNMQISAAIKNHNNSNFTIHGGPSTPNYQQACEDFLTEHKSVDIAVHGEGEITITEMFECLSKKSTSAVECDYHAMSNVHGLTYREHMTGRYIRTGSRERMKNPDQVPSPYLSGLFDGYNGKVEAAIIETNRGCPYGCTFCDWGSATNQKIRRFDLDRVKDEIVWIAQNQVRVMWIADANYGLYDRDVEISQFIVDTKEKYGYPKEVVVNYTKNSTWRLVEIIKIFTAGGIIGQGIISIQTTDEKTLEVIDRKNIRTQRYDELAQAFMDLNLPLSTDLMIGLPGMTVESFQSDLQHYIDMDVSVKAYPTQLLPNSPMAEPGYMQKYQIKTDEHSFLTSTYSYSESDLKRMKALYEAYVMADGYSLMRYVLRFLQWEHDISAMRFIANLVDDCRDKPNDFPLLTWSVYYFNVEKSMPGGWSTFFQQLGQYIVQRYQLDYDSGLQTVLSVNAAAMPDDAIEYPITIHIEHDFEAYFQQSTEERKGLTSFVSASMTFSDPNRLSTTDLNSAQYDSHQYFWELYSPVARAKSIAKPDAQVA